jgi:hypothetical protein
MQQFSVAKINELMTFKEITTALPIKNHTEPISALCGQNAELFVIKSGTTPNHCCALKG